MLTIVMAMAAGAVPAESGWTMQRDNRLCTASRAFPAAGVTVRIMPWPIGARTEVTVIGDAGPAAGRGRSALVGDAGGRAQGAWNASALMLAGHTFGEGVLTIGDAAPIRGSAASGIA